MQHNQIPHLPGRQPTNWKIIISQGFSHKSESPEPHIMLPRMRVWHQEEEPPEHLAMKPSRA